MSHNTVCSIELKKLSAVSVARLKLADKRKKIFSQRLAFIRSKAVPHAQVLGVMSDEDVFAIAS